MWNFTMNEDTCISSVVDILARGIWAHNIEGASNNLGFDHTVWPKYREISLLFTSLDDIHVEIYLILVKLQINLPFNKEATL